MNVSTLGLLVGQALAARQQQLQPRLARGQLQAAALHPRPEPARSAAGQQEAPASFLAAPPAALPKAGFRSHLAPIQNISGKHKLVLQPHSCIYLFKLRHLNRLRYRLPLKPANQYPVLKTEQGKWNGKNHPQFLFDKLHTLCFAYAYASEDDVWRFWQCWFLLLHEVVASFWRAHLLSKLLLMKPLFLLSSVEGAR